jgi:hypoxanthine phosphoribosyltransferase
MHIKRINHEEFLVMIGHLGQQIIDHVTRECLNPILVPVIRGGLVPAVYLSHDLDMPIVNIEELKGSEWLFRAGRLTPQNIIIIEDVVDKGTTMRLPDWADLRNRGVKVAALVDKTWTPSDCKPDFVATTEDCWVKFHWEKKDS